MSECVRLWQQLKGLGRLYILWLNQFVALFFTHFFPSITLPLSLSFVWAFTCVRSRFHYTVLSEFSLFLLPVSHTRAFISVADSSCFPFRIPNISRIYSSNLLCYLARTPTRNLCVCVFVCMWLALWRNVNNKQTNKIHWGIWWILIWISFIRWITVRVCVCICVLYRSPIKMFCFQFIRTQREWNELHVLAALKKMKEIHRIYRLTICLFFFFCSSSFSLLKCELS